MHDRERNGTISERRGTKRGGEGKAAAIRLDFTDTGGYRTSGRRSIVYRSADAIAITVSARERDARHDVREGKTGRERERDNSRDPSESDMAVAVAWRIPLRLHGRYPRTDASILFFFFLFYLGTRSYARLSHFSRSR